MDKLNYRKLWRYMMQLKTSNVGSKNNIYNDPLIAKSYDSSALVWKDGIKRASELNVSRFDTVLDIGSGPGILAIPLSKRVNSVTAIEPSSLMLELLDDNAKEKGITNINKIDARWEDTYSRDIGKFDVVIASYSLMMEELGKAIKQMNNLARKAVYLYWFFGIPDWEKIKIDLYPLVHGKQFVSGPKTDVIYGLLSELGISANVRTLIGTSFDHEYSDMNEAIKNMRTRLDLSRDDDRFDSIFREYIELNYKRTETGTLMFVDNSNYVEISWKPICL